MLMETIRRHMCGECNREDELILAFADDDDEDQGNAPFSIQKISRQAFAISKFLSPGNYYQPNQIMYVLMQLNLEQTLFPNFKIHSISNDEPLIFEKILDAINLELCTNADH